MQQTIIFLFLILININVSAKNIDDIDTSEQKQDVEHLETKTISGTEEDTTQKSLSTEESISYTANILKQSFSKTLNQNFPLQFRYIEDDYTRGVLQNGGKLVKNLFEDLGQYVIDMQERKAQGRDNAQEYEQLKNNAVQEISQRIAELAETTVNLPLKNQGNVEVDLKNY